MCVQLDPPMRTHTLRLALQTNKHGNQETTQVTLSVHLSGDILNDANCAAKGYPFIGSPPGPSIQPNAPLGDHSCIDAHLAGEEAEGYRWIQYFSDLVVGTRIESTRPNMITWLVLSRIIGFFFHVPPKTFPSSLPCPPHVLPPAPFSRPSIPGQQSSHTLNVHSLVHPSNKSLHCKSRLKQRT